ncbi:MAG: hypothetical protein RIB79_03080 [Allomuricauda sp.]|jgi:hypothetical protein|uniref:Uncharacterized protein n=1 Tax=Flagellimonas oceani TaxID=2698672 RepID=A0A6G7IYH0_9FLAO|nr:MULTISPECIES: hypothetical protein [Allomuricauda]QII43653.1 hypothetical protein GVT53_02815 [Allomuricauda oceani]
MFPITHWSGDAPKGPKKRNAKKQVGRETQLIAIGVLVYLATISEPTPGS